MRGSLLTPSMAAMRPLVIAGPMCRASMAPKLFESSLTVVCAATLAASATQITKQYKVRRIELERIGSFLPFFPNTPREKLGKATPRRLQSNPEGVAYLSPGLLYSATL